MTEALAVLESARIFLGALLAGLGLVFVMGGAVGLLRFPDVYTRAHAVLTSDSIGAALVAIGLALVSWEGAISARLALLGLFFAVLAPTNMHIVVNAAHAGGLSPVAGRYVAPRPSPDSKGGSR